MGPGSWSPACRCPLARPLADFRSGWTSKGRWTATEGSWPSEWRSSPCSADCLLRSSDGPSQAVGDTTIVEGRNECSIPS
jgi:hypothetical protein